MLRYTQNDLNSGYIGINITGNRVHPIFANISVGAKHSGSKSLLITNKLSAGMLRPCKVGMHPGNQETAVPCPYD